MCPRWLTTLPCTRRSARRAPADSGRGTSAATPVIAAVYALAGPPRPGTQAPDHPAELTVEASG